MYATLEQFLRMTPSEQSRVTHLDLCDKPVPWNILANANLDCEEYPGEGKLWGEQK